MGLEGVNREEHPGYTKIIVGRFHLYYTSVLKTLKSFIILYKYTLHFTRAYDVLLAANLVSDR